MARIVGIGGAILVLALIMALGFANCIKEPPACTSDPCSTLWLHCTWATFNSAIVVALIAVGIAAGLAWWYQRRNKVMEFQFNTLKEAQTVYRDLSNSAWEVFIQRSRIRLVQRESPDRMRLEAMERDLQRRADALHGALTSAHTLMPINCVLFAPETQAHWGRILTRMHQVTFSDNLWENYDHLQDVVNDRVAFIKAAATEIGLPYTEFPSEGPETMAREAEVQELLQRIEPRRGPQPDSGNRER